MCLLPKENEQLILEESPFFPRKVIIFIGSETKTHILLKKINEKQFAKVSSLSIIILLE